MSHRRLIEDHEVERGRARTDTPRWVRRHLAPHLFAGTRVLDVGCGAATSAVEVARRFPESEIVALDEIGFPLSRARRDLRGHANASVIAADVRALPFDDDSFDVVYSRFLLGRVPEKRRAVLEFARVCRPGGTVLVADVDGQFVNHHPSDPRLHRDLVDAVALLAPTGLDPFVGRRLWGLLRQAGLCGGGLEIEQHEAVAGSVRPEVRARWEESLERAAELLGTLRFEDAHGLAERVLDYLDRDDTITFSLLFTVWAHKA
jgi:SAM-dependent methyltransferase